VSKLLNRDPTKKSAALADRKARAERKADRKTAGVRAIMVRAGKLKAST
jgi:hypothetical protein